MKTNKLLDYGLKAAEVGRILLESEPTPQKLYSGDKTYYSQPEVLPFLYAMACVQVALELNPAIRPLYTEIIRAWALPGCQLAIQDFRKNLQGKSESLKGKAPGLNYLFSLIDKERSKFGDRQDFTYLLDRFFEFIKVGFNRAIDRANEKLKVVPSLKLPWLFLAVSTWTLADYLGIKLENWNKYRPLVRNGKVYDTDSSMSRKPPPTAGPEREVYREVTRVMKWYGKQVRDKTLLKNANQWYKCRVDPGTIEAYLNSLAGLDEENPKYLDQGRVSNDIRPFDLATGHTPH